TNGVGSLDLGKYRSRTFRSCGPYLTPACVGFSFAGGFPFFWSCPKVKLPTPSRVTNRKVAMPRRAVVVRMIQSPRSRCSPLAILAVGLARSYQNSRSPASREVDGLGEVEALVYQLVSTRQERESTTDYTDNTDSKYRCRQTRASCRVG